MYNGNQVSKRAKIAAIMPIFKKEDPLDKTNYRPISILPTVSKIFRKNIIQSITMSFK